MLSNSNKFDREIQEIGNTWLTLLTVFTYVLIKLVSVVCLAATAMHVQGILEPAVASSVN